MKTGDKLDLTLRGFDRQGNPIASTKIGDRDATCKVLKAEQGKPIPENGVLLGAVTCPEHPDTLHGEVLSTPYDRRPPSDVVSTRKGPAKVATEGYRNGWDRVFSKDLN